ncbi:MAG: beta-lactamase family protein [Anaerolineae bacterium]|nr:beta-lactamase family protein [Anaerolineae bacterium]
MKRLLILVAAVMLIALPVLAQDATPYSDPEGLFTTSIPAGWTQVDAEGYVLFEHEESGVTIALLALPAEDKETARDATWALIDPTFEGAPLQTLDLPGPGGVIWTQYVYLTAGVIDVVIVQIANNIAYVTVVHAPTAGVLQSVAPDVDQVLLSFQPSNTLDLSGVTPAQFDSEMAEALTSYIEDHLNDYATVGASVAIVQDGEIVYTQGFGQTIEEDGQPVTTDTLFMIGSTTKSMTSLLAAMLVDEGVWDWNDLVVDVYPDFALADMDVASELRVRDLFNMSTGVPRFDFPLFLQMVTAEDIIADMENLPITAAPGEEFQYSNQMYATGGYLAALAAGGEYGALYDAYADLLNTQIFEPLGMETSTVDFDMATASPNFALPHAFDVTTSGFSPTPLNYERFATQIAPAGAVWSSANDMAQYMIMEMSGGVAPDGTRIVSEANLHATQSAEIAMPSGGSYGMGWMIQDYKGLTYIEHGGNTGGFTSTFGFLPDAGIGVLVLANRSLDNSFGSAVSEYVFEQVFDLEHTSTVYYQTAEDRLFLIVSQVLASVQTADVDLDAAEAVVGTYERGLEVSIQAGELVFTSEYGTYVLKAVRGAANAYTTTGIDAGMLLTFGDDSVTLESILGPYIGEPQSITLMRVEGLA